jgi:hypothetical protein
MRESYCLNLGCFGVVKDVLFEPFCSECESFTLCQATGNNDTICAIFMGYDAVKIVWCYNSHCAATFCLIDAVETVNFQHVLMPSRPPDDLWHQVCKWVSSRKQMIPLSNPWMGVFQKTNDTSG